MKRLMRYSKTHYRKIKVASIILLTMAISGMDLAAREKGQTYIGTNPLSYALSFQIDENLQRFLPILTGNEYGLSLVAGRYVSERTAVEGRFILGNIHQYVTVGQLHVGVSHHLFFNTKKDSPGRLYAGVYLKYWDYHNRLTKRDFHNFAPYFVVGSRRHFGNAMVDLRLNQTTMVFSWSDLEETGAAFAPFLSPWPEFIKVLPTITCTIGYSF